MTGPQVVYAETLNLLGTGVIDDSELQKTIDQEHAAADPKFARTLAKRWTADRMLMTN